MQRIAVVALAVALVGCCALANRRYYRVTDGESGAVTYMADTTASPLRLAASYAGPDGTVRRAGPIVEEISAKQFATETRGARVETRFDWAEGRCRAVIVPGNQSDR